MTKILMVDDDVTVLEIYRQRFLRDGFEVKTVEDGLAATEALRAGRPDLVILDLLMPKLSGIEVLKFIRAESNLKSLPVVIFTNSFMTDLADAASSLGIQRALVKSQCTPETLVQAVREILTGSLVSESTSTPPSAAAPIKATTSPASAAESSARVRQQFLESGPATLRALRQLHLEFTECTDPTQQANRLDTFCRKTHYVTTLAGLAGCHRIALLSGALVALLFGLLQRPTHIDASTLNTITKTLGFLELLFGHERETVPERPLAAQVLVVDDDPLSNHLALAALHRAHLTARAADNPLIALELLKQYQFDLILLDIEMPHMTGFDLCRKLRTLPGYAQTPVIYVTAHNDFSARATGVLSGGQDLIAKPVFPIELAVKAVTHLIKSRLPRTAAGQ